MERTQESQDAADARATMYMLGGVAMMVFGAGLILSNPIVRRFMAQAGGNGLGMITAVIPDFERYLKLRNM